MDEPISNIDLMKIAIEEQSKCPSYPKVGAVVAKNGKILSRAFRSEVPKKHAERIAIEKLPPSELIGAKIVTTLEPCIEFKSQQPEKPCTELIINCGITEVIIGVLDPNGKIYCQGYEKLLENSINVSFFTPSLRETVEAITFKYGDCNRGFGRSGKRRVAVVGSGKKFEIQFSRSDKRSIEFRWNTLQFSYGVVDLIGANDSIRCAIGAQTFDQITDPLVFREASHYARMKEGEIAVIYPPNGLFIILIRLIEMTEFDIYFQWQVREK